MSDYVTYIPLEDGRRPYMTRTASRKTKIFYLHLSFFVDDHQFTVFEKENQIKSNAVRTSYISRSRTIISKTVPKAHDDCVMCMIDSDLLDRVFLFAHGPVANGEVVGVFATALFFPLNNERKKKRNR